MRFQQQVLTHERSQSLYLNGANRISPRGEVTDNFASDFVIPTYFRESAICRARAAADAPLIAASADPPRRWIPTTSGRLSCDGPPARGSAHWSSIRERVSPCPSVSSSSEVVEAVTAAIPQRAMRYACVYSLTVVAKARARAISSCSTAFKRGAFKLDETVFWCARPSSSNLGSQEFKVLSIHYFILAVRRMLNKNKMIPECSRVRFLNTALHRKNLRRRSLQVRSYSSRNFQAFMMHFYGFFFNTKLSNYTRSSTRAFHPWEFSWSWSYLSLAKAYTLLEQKTQHCLSATHALSSSIKTYKCICTYAFPPMWCVIPMCIWSLLLTRISPR